MAKKRKEENEKKEENLSLGNLGFSHSYAISPAMRVCWMIYIEVSNSYLSPNFQQSFTDFRNSLSEQSNFQTILFVQLVTECLLKCFTNWLVSQSDLTALPSTSSAGNSRQWFSPPNQILHNLIVGSFTTLRNILIVCLVLTMYIVYMGVWREKLV